MIQKYLPAGFYAVTASKRAVCACMHADAVIIRSTTSAVIHFDIIVRVVSRESRCTLRYSILIEQSDIWSGQLVMYLVISQKFKFNQLYIAIVTIGYAFKKILGWYVPPDLHSSLYSFHMHSQLHVIIAVTTSTKKSDSNLHTHMHICAACSLWIILNYLTQ